MFKIDTIDKKLTAELQQLIDNKTKPLGALGQLETLALQIGLIQKSLKPTLRQPAMLVFAGDHGIANEGVSPYPQAVTQQMVLNFLQGGAAINVFCRQQGWSLSVIDAGVNAVLPDHAQLIKQSMGMGTASYLNGPAMTLAQAQEAIRRGAAQVRHVAEQGCNVIGFGEMGISNTSSAALIMHRITGIPLTECVGRGTGLDDKGLLNKLSILQRVANHHPQDHNPLQILATFGGFEIAMICGAFLQAAELKMTILVDGFIVSSALLIAHALYPEVLDYCVFSHQSNESGHRKMLDYLQAKPLLKIDLRLGEGSGAVLAYPLLQSALAFLHEMASFQTAGVSQSDAHSSHQNTNEPR